MGGSAELTGPDLTKGVNEGDVPDGGVLVGHAHGEPVLLARRGGDVFAVGAKCTHYSGPLGEGLLVGDEIRCPWHHACFSVRTGAALRAPALDPIPCFDVTTRDGRLVVLGKRGPLTAKLPGGGPSSVVIVGGGAAGNACAEGLRRAGYARPLTLLGAEATTVVDRPNLSKDYLAGTAPEEWMRVRDEDFYSRQGIKAHVGARVTAIDVAAKRVHLESGETREYGALVL
ncbi:MAG TPA: Rieske 2Fe-2S domain-containing protein, partial [Polyangiaceae bacterium]